MIKIYAFAGTSAYGPPFDSDLSKITGDNQRRILDSSLIYQSGDRSKYFLSDIKLSSEVNKGGQLEFTAPYTSAFSSLYPPHFDENGYLENTDDGGIIYIYDDNLLIWTGFIVDKEIDFLGNQIVTCYDEMFIFQNTVTRTSILNDLTKYDNNKFKVEDFYKKLVDDGLETWIGSGANRLGKLKSGNVSSSLKNELIEFAEEKDYSDEYYSFHYIGEIIKESLLDSIGGYIIPRREGTDIYFDYLSGDDLKKNNQTLNISDNIFDLKIKMEMSNSYTGIMGKVIAFDGTYMYRHRDMNAIPRGFISGNTFYKIETLNDPKDSYPSTNPQELVDDYYYKYIQGTIPKISFEVSAFDKSLVDKKLDPIREGQLIKVISNFHRINGYFICEKIERDLLKPELSRYYIGGVSNNNISNNSKNSSKKFDYAINFSSANISKINKRLTNLGG